MTAALSPIEILAKHARGEIEHLNAGLCPDGIEGSLTRDDECPVCQALQALADKHSGEPRITLSLSLGKAKALGLLNLQAGVHAICEGDLVDHFSLREIDGAMESENSTDASTHGAIGEALVANPGAEPVAWQSRFIDPGQKWGECTKEHHDLVKAHPGEWPGYEVRELYAASPAA